MLQLNFKFTLNFIVLNVFYFYNFYFFDTFYAEILSIMIFLDLLFNMDAQEGANFRDVMGFNAGNEVMYEDDATDNSIPDIQV